MADAAVNSHVDLRRRAALLWRLGPALLLTIFGLGVLLTEYLHALTAVRPAPEYLMEFFSDYMRGDVVVIVLAVVIAPVVEEVLFRGLLLRGLLALYRPALAVVIGATIFAVVHLNLYQLVSAFCMGLLFGWIYERTRSLLLCILGHAAWNAQWWIAAALLGSPVPGYGLLQEPGAFPQQPLWWLGIGTIALVGGLRVLRARLEAGTAVYAHAA